MHDNCVKMKNRLIKQFSKLTSQQLGVFTVLLIFIGFKSLILLEPHWYPDEGLYSAFANEMSYGEIPYRDIWDHKMPGIFYIFSLARSLGNTLMWIKIFNIILSLFTLAGIYQILQKFFKSNAGLIGLIIGAFWLREILIETNITNAEILFIAFTTWGVYFLLAKRYFISGLIYGLSFLLKHHPVIEIVTLCLFILLSDFSRLSDNKRNLIKLNLGVLIPVLIIGVVFLIQGNFSDFSQAFWYNLRYASYQMPGATDALWQNIYFKSVIFGISFLLISYLKKRIKFDEKYAYILIWLSSSIFASLISNRYYLHYFIQIVPSAAVVLALIIKSTKYWKWQLVMTLLVTIGLSTTIYKTADLVCASKMQDRDCLVIQYVKDYYPNSMALITNKISRLEYENSFFIANPEGQVDQVASYVDQASIDGAYAYFADNNAWFYELSHTRAVSKYVVYYHLWYDPDNWAILANELLQKPAIIVIQNKADPNENLKSSDLEFQYVKEIRDLLKTDYQVDTNYKSDDYLVFVKKTI